MILSLDTHVLLWWLADDPTLSQTIRAAISDGKNLVWKESRVCQRRRRVGNGD